MSPKEKAKELIDKFLPNVYCYLGSGMLTNEYDEGVALNNAKRCTLICAEEILKEHENLSTIYISESEKRESYWEEVKKEVERYESTNN